MLKELQRRKDQAAMAFVAAQVAIANAATSAKAFVKRNRAALAAGSLASFGAVAHADPSTFTIDTASIVSVITSGVTTVSTIGIAVLSLVVVIKLFKWVQRVL